MAEYASLNAAMVAGDEFWGEAELRYQLLSQAFEAMPQLRANLNPALERGEGRDRAPASVQADLG